MRTGRPSGVRGAGPLPGVFALQSPQKGVRGQKMCLHLASLEVIERMREEPVGPNLTQQSSPISVSILAQWFWVQLLKDFYRVSVWRTQNACVHLLGKTSRARGFELLFAELSPCPAAQLPHWQRGRGRVELQDVFLHLACEGQWKGPLPRAALVSVVSHGAQRSSAQRGVQYVDFERVSNF